MALGPAAASATGFALAVIAIGPIVRGADVFRLGVALAVLVTGAELVRVGLAGTPPPLEQLMTAGLTVGLLGTAAVLSVNAVTATGGLALRNEPRRSVLFEAHPVTPTAPSSLRPTWLPRRPSRVRRAERAPDAHRLEASTAQPAAQAELWSAEEPTPPAVAADDATAIDEPVEPNADEPADEVGRASSAPDDRGDPVGS